MTRIGFNRERLNERSAGLTIRPQGEPRLLLKLLHEVRRKSQALLRQTRQPACGNDSRRRLRHVEYDREFVGPLWHETPQQRFGSRGGIAALGHLVEELVLDTSDFALTAESPHFGFETDPFPFRISHALRVGSRWSGDIASLQSTE